MVQYWTFIEKNEVLMHGVRKKTTKSKIISGEICLLFPWVLTIWSDWVVY